MPTMTSGLVSHANVLSSAFLFQRLWKLITTVLRPRLGGFFVEPLGGSFGVEAESGIGLEVGVWGRRVEFGGVYSGLRA